MRYFNLFLLPAAMLAQIYVYDTDGRRVLLAAPEEKRERRVVEDGPNGRVSEEIVTRRDANGNKLPPEKLRVVEQQAADGSTVVETITYQSDLNGRLAATERAVVTTQQQQGGQTKTISVVERPTVNGPFAAVEKTASQTVATGGKQQTNRSTYVLDQSGKFVEAVREIIEKAPEGKGAREVTQEFRNAPTGRMELTGQKIKIDTPNADGTSTSEITVYGVAAPGRSADGPLKLREQQLVTTRPGPGNTLIESISVRRPDLSDSKLGAYQKVGEKVTPMPMGGAGKP